MEMVLDVYKRPYGSRFPVVCMDESPKQLIGEIKTPVKPKPGRTARHDYEYKRNGMCNIFMACEPLKGQRIVKITERKTKKDWAHFLNDIASAYQDAEKITLVMDNLTPMSQERYTRLSSLKRQRICGIGSNLFILQNMVAG